MQSNKRRLLWLYPKLTTWMGGSKFVYEACKRLAERYEVIVITQESQLEVSSTFKEKSIEIIDIELPTFTSLSFWFGFNRSLNRNASKLKELIHEDDLILTSMFPMHCIANRLGIEFSQIIYEPFAMFHDKDYQNGQKLLVKIFCKLMSRLYAFADIEAVKKASNVMTLSSYEEQNCKKLYGVDSTIIYEGVDTDFFYPRETGDLKKLYGEKRILLHSTGFDSFKGTDFLIRSMPALIKKYPDLKLLITYTREDKSQITHYKKFLEGHSISSNVEFLGHIPYEKLPEYYSLADLYIEPGIGRSMSFSSKEANACGTPSVRGDRGTEDTVDGETGILVSCDDSEKLAKEVAELIQDNSSLEEMSKKSIDMVIQTLLGHMYM